MTPVRTPPMPTRSIIALLVCSLLGACAGSSNLPPPGQVDPEVKKAERQRLRDIKAAADKKEDLPQLMIDLSLAIDSYTTALSNRGVATADKKAENLSNSLNKIVDKHYDELATAAANSSDPYYQSIALSALGFASKQRDVMPVILQGAQTSNEAVVTSAVYGLAILQDPRTPPGVIIAVMENRTFKDDTRTGAAWALYRVQEKAPDSQEIIDYWVKMLQRPMLDITPDAIAMHAVRGVGLTRKPDHAALVAPFASHPTPKVRVATAIALARMNAQDQVEALLALIGPAEKNPDARLAGRKALAALAGGEDCEYDVVKWRAVFQRKSQ
jgi:HEAT repeats